MSVAEPPPAPTPRRWASLARGSPPLVVILVSSVAVTLIVSGMIEANPWPCVLPSKALPAATTTGMFRASRAWTESVISWPASPSAANWFER